MHVHACLLAGLTRAAVSKNRSPGGVIEHDLSKTDFEVADTFPGLDEAGSDQGDDAEAPAPAKLLSPRRKWLLRQEVTADTPRDAAPDDEASRRNSVGDGAGKDQWRGRVAMRRVRQKAVDLLASPLRRNGAALRKMDSTMSYRL